MDSTRKRLKGSPPQLAFYFHCIHDGAKMNTPKDIKEHLSRDCIFSSINMFCGQCGEVYHDKVTLWDHINRRETWSSQSNIPGYYSSNFNVHRYLQSKYAASRTLAASASATYAAPAFIPNSQPLSLTFEHIPHISLFGDTDLAYFVFTSTTAPQTTTAITTCTVSSTTIHSPLSLTCHSTLGSSSPSPASLPLGRVPSVPPSTPRSAASPVHRVTSSPQPLVLNTDCELASVTSQLAMYVSWFFQICLSNSDGIYPDAPPSSVDRAYRRMLQGTRFWPGPDNSYLTMPLSQLIPHLEPIENLIHSPPVLRR